MPRCQARNRSLRRRSSSPSLERVVPVIDSQQPNAKSPDGPGEAHIAIVDADVSGPVVIAWRTSAASIGAIAVDRRMRPRLLNPLFAAITNLPGVGPKLEKLYRRLLGRDDGAARHRSAVPPADRHDRPPRAAEAARRGARHGRHRRGRPSTATGRRRRNRPRAPYQIYASDETGDLTLTYFNARKDYLEKLLPVGERRYVSGTVALYDGMLQMVHPDRVVAEADLAKLPLVEPVYPLTEGLSLNQVRKAVDAALASVCRTCRNGRSRAWLARERLPGFRRRAARAAPAGRARRRVGRKAWPGRGSPMTSFWPASSRLRWCARICAGRPAARPPATGTCARS